MQRTDSTQPPLLDVRGFGLEFRTRSGTVHALEGIDLQVHRGEIVGLVGESGSGKSVLSYALLGISDRGRARDRRQQRCSAARPAAGRSRPR